MLRTRKKDINLKPNRILDKRSSRGMLYENEELRLRTIHINDEVDKGQNSIKKLKKENEQLKREIWALRDECEKLERMLKKVLTAIEENGTLEGLGLSPDTRTSMLEFPATEFGEERSSRRSFWRESGLTEESYGESEEEVDFVEEFPPYHHHHHRDESKQGHREEISKEICGNDLDQQGNQSNSQPIPPRPPLHLSCPPPSIGPPVTILETAIIHDNEIDSRPKDQHTSPDSSKPDSPSSPPLPPIIEITPAPFFNSNCAGGGSFQNLSPIPEENKVTTEVVVESSPPGSDTSLHSQEIENSVPEGVTLRRKSFADKYKNGLLKTVDLLSFSKSAPNLSVWEEQGFSCCDLNEPGIPMTSKSPEWEPHVLIGYVETGNGVSGKSSYKLTDFRVEEIIDELEFDLGPAGLAEVLGVRLMGMGSSTTTGPVTIFVSFRSPEVLRPLAEKGIMELRNGDIRVRLLEATKKCSLVSLSSCPPQIPDNYVIRVLNQFGQVVAPIQRNYYKGVDISERVARMYVCRKLPQTVNIWGYECPAKISSQAQLAPNSPKHEPVSSARTSISSATLIQFPVQQGQIPARPNSPAVSSNKQVQQIDATSLRKVFTFFLKPKQLFSPA